ncbi:MAG: sugar phosphate nucleotidyltransferase [bacterium]
MKGVILAGGLGSRLFPLTLVTNKHLLPIYNKPMIFYPLKALVRAGIEEVMIVTGGNSAGDFLRLLGNGADFGLKSINYAYQKGEGGIAEALGLARHFLEGERSVVILGDNVFEEDILPFVEKFRNQKSGAKVLLKEVADPERFGVAELDGERIVGIEEKPKAPKSRYAVTGVYMYDEEVFNIIETLRPSGRGEMEITDVNNAYIAKGNLTYDLLQGWWTDAGTFNSLLRANILIAQKHDVRWDVLPAKGKEQ